MTSFKNLDLKTLRQAWREIRQKGKSIPEYKKLMRKRYRTPQGYEDFAEVALDVAGHCYSVRHLMPHINAKIDFAETVAYYLSGCLATSESPVYWLGAQLLQAMLQTDLPKEIIVDSLHRPIPSATIMLPKGIVYTPDDEEVTYICFKHVLKNDSVPAFAIGNNTIKLNSAPFNCVLLFTSTKESTVYAANNGLFRDDRGELEKGNWTPSRVYKELQIDNQNSESTERHFLETLKKIILQVILIFQTRPDLLETGQEIGFGNVAAERQAKKLPAKCNILLNPNWIGKNYQLPREKSADMGGTHASPRTHWRRGHLRHVAIGTGRNHRKLCWIEPILVNAHSQ